METYSDLRLYSYKLVKIYGLKEALFICNLHYYIKMSNHNHDGHKWVYNTHDKWCELLSFGKTTIRKIIKVLIEKEVLITGNYNRLPIDQTLWYSLNYRILPIAPNWPENRTVNSEIDVSHLDTPNVKCDTSQLSESDSPLPSKYHLSTENIIYIDLSKKGLGLDKIKITQEQYDDLLARAGTEFYLIEKLKECQIWILTLEKYNAKDDYKTIHSFIKLPQSSKSQSQQHRPQNQTYDDGQGMLNDLQNCMRANGYPLSGEA